MMDPGRCACGHQSLGQISYVRNDPANLVDPDGRAVIFSPNPFLFYQSQFITGNEFNTWFNQAMGNNTMADYNTMVASYGLAPIPGYAAPDPTLSAYLDMVYQGQVALAAQEAAQAAVASCGADKSCIENAIRAKIREDGLDIGVLGNEASAALAP
jgi:hypothetical protein